MRLFILLFAGSKVLENGQLFKELLQTPNFRITVVDDADTVELCGALKVNITHVGCFPRIRDSVGRVYELLLKCDS